MTKQKTATVEEGIEMNRTRYYDTRDPETGKLYTNQLTRQDVTDANELITMMLDLNCSNGLRTVEDIGWQDPDGWNVYDFEGHCSFYRVVARNVDGKWEIRELMTGDN